MKNMKIAAAAMVMVMLASAAIVGIGASAYDADENDTTPTTPAPYEYKVNLSNNASVTIELMSNINYYSELGEASISWKVTSDNKTINADDTGTYTNDTTEVSIKPSVTKEIGQNVEKLTATVTKGNNAATGTTEFLLEATITVKKNNTSVELNPITYKVTATIESVTTLTFNDMTFIKNVNGSQDLTKGDNNTPVSPGTSDLFYAIGLPNGLSMTPDGKISGIPAKDAETSTATVYIEHNDGTYATGTLKVIITDFSFKVESAKTTTTGGTPTTLTGINGIYIVEQGATLTVEPTVSGSNYVSVRDSDGNSTLVKIDNDGKYKLDGYTAGTGAYKVYIGYADSPAESQTPASLNKVLASFDLYVVGHVVGIGSDIIIGSR